MKPEPTLTSNKKRLAILVGIISKSQEEDRSQEFLEELQFLAETYGVETKMVYSKTREAGQIYIYWGKVKLKRLKLLSKDNQIDMIIFDDELSPSQQRNLEKAFGIKILDRTNLILEIFSQRLSSSAKRGSVSATTIFITA